MDRGICVQDREMESMVSRGEKESTYMHQRKSPGLSSHGSVSFCNTSFYTPGCNRGRFHDDECKNPMGNHCPGSSQCPRMRRAHFGGSKQDLLTRLRHANSAALVYVSVSLGYDPRGSLAFFWTYSLAEQKSQLHELQEGAEQLILNINMPRTLGKRNGT